MTKAKTDKQRIKAAFKSLREQGYDAIANFESEKRSLRRERNKVSLDTSVFDLRTTGKMISNGLGDDDNIKDNVERISTGPIVITSEDVDDKVVVEALEAQGLNVNWRGEGHYITIESHLKSKYECDRFDSGKQGGHYGTGVPQFEDRRNLFTDPYYISGWIQGAFNRLSEEGCFDVADVYRNLKNQLGTYEANKVIVPMLNALVLKSYEEK